MKKKTREIALKAVARASIKLLLSLYSRYTPKRVTRGGPASGQHSSTEILLRRQAVGDIVSDLMGPEIEPKASRAKNGA